MSDEKKIKVDGGVKEAAKMLQGLNAQDARRILEEIKQKDPQTAQIIESNMLTMDEIQFLTPGMFMDFSRSIDLQDFGVALRGVNPKVIEKIFSYISSNMKREIEEGLNGSPQSIQVVEQKQSKILKVLKQLIDEGKVVINKNDEYV